MAEHKGFQDLVADAKKKITEISPTDAAQKAKSSDAVIVDVREKDEFDEAHIPDAVNFSRGTIEFEVEEKFPDRNQEIICHCGGAADPRLRPKVCKRWAIKTSAPWLAASKPGKPPVYRLRNELVKIMRPLVLILIGIATMNLASGAMEVNGVRVFGKTREVSVTEIRHAIADFVKDWPDKTKPAALEVISKTDMRAYRAQRDLGWVPMHLTPRVEVDGRKHLTWSVGDCCGIQDPPEALQIISSADQVYIFPIKNSSKPRRDDKHMRLLGTKARKELVHLLSHQNDWWPQGYSILTFPSEDVGFVFRHGKSEVVLFFDVDTVEGTVNGKFTSGLLDAKRHDQFEEWKRRYAQQKLPTRK